MRCAAPATAVSVTPRRWKNWPGWPASVAPKPWRSARCTRCSAPTPGATALIRRPAACSSTRCMPRPARFSVNAPCVMPSTLPVWRSSSAQLEELKLIDWPSRRRRQAKTAARACTKASSPAITRCTPDFASFRHAGGEALENHCRFEAIQEMRAARGENLDWRQWPEHWHDPRGAALGHSPKNTPMRIGYFAFCQWLIHRCLERAQTAARSAGMGIGLIADLAVGADGAGSQAWSFQDELLASLTVGAPPDILNRSGQGWGISAFSPEGLIRNGFRAFIDMLRANFAHAGGLRIDHVMGLQRLWVIPNGAAPARWRLPVLPGGRPAAFADAGVPSSPSHRPRRRPRHRARRPARKTHRPLDARHARAAVRTGQRRHFKPILDWPDNALATTSTHDLPTLNGWWHGRDIDWNARLGFVDANGEIEWRQHRQREREGLRSALEPGPAELSRGIPRGRPSGRCRRALPRPHPCAAGAAAAGRCAGHQRTSEPARHHRHPPELVDGVCPAPAKHCSTAPMLRDAWNCWPARGFRLPSVTNEPNAYPATARDPAPAIP